MTRSERTPTSWIGPCLAGAFALAPCASFASERELLDCVIHPHVVVALGSGDAGLLETVHFDRAERVQAGDVVARLESEVERAAVELARARAGFDTDLRAREVALAFDERARERAGDLYDQKAVPFTLLDEAERDAVLARYQVKRAEEERRLARLDLQRAEAQLRRRTIRSPISGVVVERFKSPGEYVEDEPVLEIAQLDPLRIEVIVPVELFGTVHAGMGATIATEHDEGAIHTATVTAVDQVLDAASGTFGVRLSLPNPDLRLPAGLRCKLAFAESHGSGADAPDPAPVSAAAPTAPSPDLTDQAPAAVADEEPVLRSEPPATRATPATALARVPLVEAASAARQCRTVGPLAQGTLARTRAAVAPRAVGLAVREATITRAAGYLVVAEPGPDGVDAVVATLRANAVRDFFVFRRKSREGQIALGVYSRHDLAEGRIRRLASAGVDARLERREQSEPAWWIDLELHPERGRDAELQRLAAAIAPGVTVAPHPCSELVAAGS